MAAEESTAWPAVSRPTRRRRPRLRLQVEHGLDARHARVLRARPGPPPLPPRRAHLQPRLRLHRELRAAALARRGRARQGLAAVEACRATTGSSYANLRALYAYMWAHPGKKLLFMGGELAQEQEWSHERSLDWHLLERPPPRRRAAPRARPQPPLPRPRRRSGSSTPSPTGFRWLVVDDRDANVLAFARFSAQGVPLVMVANLSPVPRPAYRVPMPLRRALARGAELRRGRSTAGANLGNLGGVRRRTTRPGAREPASAELMLPAAGRGLADAGGVRPARVLTLPWERPLGATPAGDGTHDLPRLGAARAAAVAVAVGGARRAARAGGPGRLRGRGRRPRPGDDYRLRGRRRRAAARPVLALPARGRARALARRRSGRLRAGATAAGRGLDRDDLVIYELHVGTFTPEGTFAARGRAPAPSCASSASPRSS